MKSESTSVDIGAAVIAMVPAVWVIAGLFWLRPIPDDFTWWAIPWGVTVIVVGVMVFGFVGQWLSDHVSDDS